MRPNAHFILLGVALLLLLNAYALVGGESSSDPATEAKAEESEREMMALEDALGKSSAKDNEKAIKKLRAVFAKMKHPQLTITHIREWTGRQSNVSAEKLDHYEVLGRCEASGALQQSWEGTLLKPDTYGSLAAMCFDPGLFLHWRDSNNRYVKASVCLSCKQIIWDIDGASHHSVLSRNGVLALGELYLQLFQDPAYEKKLKESQAWWAESEARRERMRQRQRTEIRPKK